MKTLVLLGEYLPPSIWKDSALKRDQKERDTTATPPTVKRFKRCTLTAHAMNRNKQQQQTLFAYFSPWHDEPCELLPMFFMTHEPNALTQLQRGCQPSGGEHIQHKSHALPPHMLFLRLTLAFKITTRLDFSSSSLTKHFWIKNKHDALELTQYLVSQNNGYTVLCSSHLTLKVAINL